MQSLVKKITSLFRRQPPASPPPYSAPPYNTVQSDTTTPVNSPDTGNWYDNHVKPHVFTLILTAILAILISIAMWDEIVSRVLLNSQLSLKTVGIVALITILIGLIVLKKPMWYRKVIDMLRDKVPVLHGHAQRHYATVNIKATEWTDRFQQADHRERWRMVKIPLILLALLILIGRYGQLFMPPTVATAFPGADSEESPLDADIEVIFDRSMNRASVERAFRIEPSISGTFRWEGSQKITFDPEKNLERGREYRIFFEGPVLSSMYIPQLRASGITFRTIGNPKIVLSAPLTQAPEDLTPVTVMFDRPMIPFTTATNSAVRKPAFTVSPDIAGEGKWMGTTVYQFRPSTQYKKATTYTVTVDRSLKSHDGGVLSGDHSWSFSSVRPVVLSVTPTSGYDFASPTASIAAFFSQPMKQTTADSIVVTDSNKRPVAGRIVVVNNGIGFYPSQPLRRQASYTATVVKGVQSTEGPNGLEYDYQWNFTVAALPQVIKTTPKNNEEKVKNENQIMVGFKTPMDEDSLKQNVRIEPTPETAPNIYYNSYSNHELSIGTYLGRSQKYTVTIGANARDQHGTALGRDYTFTFTTDAYKPAVGIYPNGTYFAAFNQHEIPRIVAQTVNTKKVTYTLYKLKREDVLELYRKRYVYDICGNSESCRNWQDYNPSKLEKVKSWSESYEADFNTPVHVVTKVTNTSNAQISAGMYYLDVRIPEGPHDNMVMIVSKSALTVKRSPGQIFAWAVDQKSTDTISNMKMDLVDHYGKVLSSGTTNGDGVFMKTADLRNREAMLLFGQSGDDMVVAASSWSEGMNRYDFGLPSYYSANEYSEYDQKERHKLYLTLDRPIFRPGQKVHFKGVVRKDSDGAYSSIGKGEKVQVTVVDQQNKQLYSKALPITSFGSYSDNLDLSTTSSLGWHQITASYGGQTYRQSFQVEEYRKQDYSVTVKPGKDRYVDGERADITVSGSYYFGAPVTDAAAAWTLQSYDYDFQWDQDWRFEFGDPDRYWRRYWSYSQPGSTGGLVTQGEGTTNSQGEIELSVPLNLSDKTSSQMMRLEAVVYDSNNQALSDSKEFVVHKASVLAGVRPVRYSNQSGNPASVEVVTVNPAGSVVGNTPVSVEFFRRTWETVRVQDPDTGEFFYESRPNDSSVGTTSVTTNATGRATASFTPQQGGTYKVLARVQDAQGKIHVSGSFVWVSGSGFIAERTNNDRIALVTDKREYLVNDTLSVFVASPFASASAKTLVTAERGSVLSYKITSINENDSTVDMKVEGRHTPNIFVGAMVVKPGTGVTNPAEFKVGYTEVKVSDNNLKLAVSVTTDKKRYKPGETMKARIQTRNLNNQPVSTEIAVGLVDKAVWDLASADMTDIYNVFYQPRNLEVETAQLLTMSLDRVYANVNLGAKGGSGGGCFVGDTLILMKGGGYKKIKDIKKGELVLTRESDQSSRLVEATVMNTFHHVVDRYLIINGELKVTPVHKMFVNGQWVTAAQIEIGDQLINEKGNKVTVHSIEHIGRGSFDVYNLHIDKQHTFFAGGMYVHNEKGGFATSRRNFPDTAYWNPHVTTDANGVAELSIKLPDSLTTWRLSAVANSEGAAFGSEVNEVIVSRDVLIRPFIPRFLSVGDEAKLGAIVVNTSGQNQTLNVSIRGQGIDIIGSPTRNVTIADGAQAKLTWDTRAKSGTGATIGFAIRDTQGVTRDAMEVKLPVTIHHVPETVAVAGQAKDVAEEKIVLPSDIVKDQGQATVQLAPSLGSAGLSSYSYLMTYPYYGSEQTVSRMAPAIYLLRVMKEHEGTDIGAYNGKTLERIVSDGLQRLKAQQHADGGWGWWMNYGSDAFITALVYTALYDAKSDGYTVDDKILSKAENYLRNALSKGVKEATLNEQALVLYALRHNPRGLASYAQNLFERRYELSVESRAYLSMAMRNIGGMNALSKRLHNEVLSLVKKTATSSHWEESKRHYAYMGSNTTTTATVLESMIAFDRHNPLITESIRYLMSIRTEDHWDTTRDTASVIKSLTHHIMSSSEGTGTKAFKIELNGKSVKTGQFSKGDLIRVAEQVISLNQFKTDFPNSLRISGSGSGNLYYSVNMKYFLPFDEVNALDQGIVVDRELINSDGELLSKERIAEGAEAWIRLTVAVPEDRHYVIVEDMLPAGFEAVNESLKNVSTLNKQAPRSQNKEANQTWYTFNHREYRDDRVALFADYLPAGIYEVSYRIRATTPGRYHYPPARAYQMYLPDVSGHSDGGWLTVIERSE